MDLQRSLKAWLFKGALHVLTSGKAVLVAAATLAGLWALSATGTPAPAEEASFETYARYAPETGIIKSESFDIITPLPDAIRLPPPAREASSPDSEARIAPLLSTDGIVTPLNVRDPSALVMGPGR